MLRYTIRPLVSCERRGWLRANVSAATLVRHIVCVRRTDETNQIPAEGRLNPAEHQLERVSVAALGPQDPHRFLL